MIRDAEWSFRDEIYAASHRWYLIVICCLTGSLLGWLLSYLWPSPYQAAKELFVGLNISPTAGEPGARLPVVNANDYKNWQMASLNTVIFTDEVIGETLSRLRSLNPYWNAVDQEQLTAMLRVYWRNAGKWRLVAEHENPLHAADAVHVWETVVVERVHAAVAQSQQTVQINLALQASAGDLADLEARLALLEQQRREVQHWIETANSAPSAPLAPPERANLDALATALGWEDTPISVALTLPAADQPAGRYLPWLQAAEAMLNRETAVLITRREAQQASVDELTAAYSQAMSASLGLAPEMVVQKLSDRKLRLTVVRPTGQAMLIGAALGWIAWALLWLVRPAIRAGV